MNREQIEDSYRLSPLQQGMLFHSLDGQQSGVDVEQIICNLHEDLNLSAFWQAWRNVVRRHPILRTRFRWAGLTTPLQDVYVDVHLPVDESDLRLLSSEEQENHVEAYLAADRRRGFDLTEAPLMRLATFRLAEMDYRLVWSCHHLLIDGRALVLILNEVFDNYKALREGREFDPLPTRAYRDYIDWLHNQDLSQAEHYWRQELKGLEAPTALPGAHVADPANQSDGHREQWLGLSASLTSSVEELAKKSQVTVNSVLQGAWALLLSRYGGQDDVVFGAIRACRRSTIDQAELIVGLFINTLPVRIRVPADMQLIPWLKQIRRQQMGVRDYEHTPLAKVQAWSAIPRSVPIFESMLNFQNPAWNDALRAQGAEWQHRDFDIRSQTNYPLSVDGYGGPELSFKIEYDPRRFDDGTITRMLGHLKSLLESMTANAEQQLSELEMLTDAERHQLLVEWNDTKTNFPRDRCVQQLFEQQVQRTPEATALVFGDQQLTYRELNQRSNQLAHYLRKLGVGPEIMVGLCVERSLDMAIGVLGVLKAGGAYVPMDAAYPQERLKFMLEDGSVQVLLTQDHLTKCLPEHACEQVRLDSDWGKVVGEAEENPECFTAPENLAYVIYTSGSTGQPKGVMITHEAVVNHSVTAARDYEIAAGDRVLQFASISFDVAAEEMFPSWLNGATLVLRSEQATDSFDAFHRFLQDERITVVNLPTPFWHEWVSKLSHDEEQLPPDLRLVVVGSDKALVDRLVLWQKLAGDRVRWINAYGPTEATVGATAYEPARGAKAPRSVIVPVGRPTANRRVYLLDNQLHPVPVGVAGELHIGGVGLARGYLNRPELSAEKFIPDPFSDEPGARIYKTGDLARYLPDGNIEFLDRLDQQVKIRGFRIELGEVESVLATHKGVRECTVVARDGVSGEKRLVAYVVANTAVAGTTGAEAQALAVGLRGHIQERLPGYMVPGTFILLDELPLTPNGKVDRRALTSQALPEQSGTGQRETFDAPRTDVERTLAAIWAGVLGIEQVGLHDNFFDLGGDSILSIQIIGRANQAGLRLTPKQLFKFPTVAELAAAIEAVPNAPALKAEQGAVTGSIPLTPIQHWFFEQDFTDPHHWNMAMMLDARQSIDPVLLERALQHLVGHHDALRLRFERVGENWQGVLGEKDGSTPILSQVDLSVVPEAEQDAIMERAAGEVQAGLSLTQGHLIRATLFERGTQRPQRLLIVIHHLAIDGVSWRVLLEDLHAAYGQLCGGRTIELPPKTTSFKAWSSQLAEHARALALTAEPAYWTDEARRRVPLLPLDHPEVVGANTEASARTVAVSLEAEETRALLQDVPEAYHTQINDVLLAALSQAVQRWTETGSLLVDLEGHGREEVVDGVDLSRTVGWFTTVFPVLLDLGEHCHEQGAALKLVKEQLRSIPNRGIGYGLLRYLSDSAETKARLRALPQAQILFNYLGQFDQALPEAAAFALSGGPCGPVHSLLAYRSHLLEINGKVTGGRLSVDFEYSENVHRRATIERFARDFIKALRELICHCCETEASGFTPSDFPLAKLDQRTLDRLSDGRQLEDIYPLSPMQQLFYAMEAAGAEIGFEQSCYTLRGDLNVVAFKRAWAEVIRRHAILRTAFVSEGSNDPLQVVYEKVELPWEELDWRGLSPAELPSRLDSLLRADARRGFELAHAPLMRLTLIHTARDSYKFVWSHHHLQLDGWSWRMVFKEVAACYQAFDENKDLVWERARPYRNYIKWLQEQNLLQAEAFWRRTLKGFKAPTRLMENDSPRHHSDAEEGYREVRLRLPAVTTEALKQLARQNRLTLNTVVQGAWSLLLSRYSGESDVVFGTAVSGRPAELAGIETMVGLFVNNLPLRVEVTRDDQLLGWLSRLQESQVALRQYECTPPMRLQEWSEVPWRHRLFESLVVFQNYLSDKASSERLGDKVQISNVDSPVRTNYPLTVMAVPGERLLLRIVFQRRSFRQETIEAVGRNLEILLEGMARAPERQLAELLQTMTLEANARPAPPAAAGQPHQPGMGARNVSASARGGRGPARVTVLHDTIQLQLKGIWEKVLGLEKVEATDNFFDLGGHSLLAVRLFNEVESVFGKALSIATLFHAPTLEQMALALFREGGQLSSSPLVPIQTGRSNKPPFFCIHAAGGNVLFYRDLVRRLEPDQPFYGVQAQGLDGRQPHHTRVEDMAAHYIREIRRVQQEGPYFLGGASFGGLVAFEMARQLDTIGERVALTALFDTHGPGYPRLLPTTSAFASRVTRYRERIEHHVGNWAMLDWPGRLTYVRDKRRKVVVRLTRGFRDKRARIARKLYLSSESALPTKLQATQAAILQCFTEYVPQVYSGRVTLFRASKQPFGIYPDPELGWSGLAGGLVIHEVPGIHGSMLTEPRVRILAAKLTECLTQAQASSKTTDLGFIGAEQQDQACLVVS